MIAPMSTRKKGEELSLRPYHAIIRAKMGFQRDSIPLAGGLGDSVPQNRTHKITSVR